MTPAVTLVLGVSSSEGRGCPVGEDSPVCVLAWACVDALCQTLHGSIEKITSEVSVCLLQLA